MSSAHDAPQSRPPADQRPPVGPVVDGGEPAVEITMFREKYRLTCPRGHTNWYPANSHFRCQSCAEKRKTNPEVEPEHDLLWDQTDEVWRSREEVSLKVGAKAER